jgi:hypothetical protein
MDRSPDHENLVITRYMELWGDQGAENDVLTINGVNVISPAVDPINKLINAMFVFDKGSDGISHPGVALEPYASITFFTGVDDFVPASIRANGTTSLVLTSRVGGGLTQAINVPNFASSDVRRATVVFNDFVQPVGIPFRAPQMMIRR